jgi:hypothetical protein
MQNASLDSRRFSLWKLNGRDHTQRRLLMNDTKFMCHRNTQSVLVTERLILTVNEVEGAIVHDAIDIDPRPGCPQSPKSVFALSDR